VVPLLMRSRSKTARQRLRGKTGFTFCNQGTFSIHARGCIAIINSSYCGSVDSVKPVFAATSHLQRKGIAARCDSRQAMHFLFPSDPLRTKRPDEFYAEEVAAVRSAGFNLSVFSFEKFQAGSFQAFPPLPVATVIYRGWMLSRREYERFAAAIVGAGATPFTDTKSYLLAHHLPNWYPAIAELTPETRIFPVDTDLAAVLRSLSWPEYFIKDYVKSLKTSIGSRISTPEQAETVAAEMRCFRGTIEGGGCVRRVESFLPETEQRYFVLDGVPHAASGHVPTSVENCARRITSRFFSVDVVKRVDGVLRVVEIGDGQVSDLVGWKTEQFLYLFSRFAQQN